ncbi:MAG: MBL fold metallo-hydrolase [Ruminococcaceae bacterium]|nr:MBL fold metallo-hydrolase [Oscillospiraceae bacterium]
MRKNWDSTFPPFKVYGNLYSLGNYKASTHLLKTDDGIVLFDTGYQESLYLVIQNMWELGFNPKDIRHIFHTHAHIDHFGATKSLVNMTGAKTYIGTPDRACCTGEANLSFAEEMKLEFDGFFEPDVCLLDGDEIKIGSTVIKCVATPGHTEGAMSYFFNVCENDITLRVGIHGGAGLNSMEEWYLKEKGLPLDMPQIFVGSMEKLKEEHVDIYVGNHMAQNNAKEKYEKLIAGDKNAFVNPDEWVSYLNSAIDGAKEYFEI